LKVNALPAPAFFVGAGAPYGDDITVRECFAAFALQVFLKTEFSKREDITYGEV